MKLQFDTDSNHEILVFINNAEIKSRWIEDNQYFYQVNESEAVANLEVLCIPKASKPTSIKTRFSLKFIKGYKIYFPFFLKAIYWLGMNNYGHYNRTIKRIERNSSLHGEFIFSSTKNCWGVEEPILLMDIIKNRGVDISTSKKFFGYAGKQLNKRFVGEILFILFARSFFLAVIICCFIYDLTHLHQTLRSTMLTGVKSLFIIDIPLLLIHTSISVYYIFNTKKERKKNFDL